MKNKTRQCREPNCVEDTHAEGAWLCLTHKKKSRKYTCSKYGKNNRKKLAKWLKAWRTETAKGFLCFVYSNMRNRIKGVTGHPNPDLWRGKPLLNKDDFYDWALKDSNFIDLFKSWQTEGRGRLSTPSIDRIDSDDGYLIGNMRWVTFEENSRNNDGLGWFDEQE